MSTQEGSSEKTIRNAADFHPNIWGKYFLTCPSDVIKHLVTNYMHSLNMHACSLVFVCIQTIDTWTEQHHKELKEEVRRMIASDADKPAHKLRLIDAVQRLGVAYHFGKEIDDALEKISHDPFDDKDDLHIVSLCFRLLRQHGIKMSCGMKTFLSSVNCKIFPIKYKTSN